MEFRIEYDTMGEVRVPADKLWGAQTQRSLENFKIGEEKMPMDLIYAITTIKAASARANTFLGVLDAPKQELIQASCDEILSGKHDSQFPLSLWQTGSGTQTNMNVNEVIANIANFTHGKNMLHPNDDVNKSQSTNDVFPTAIHITAYTSMREVNLSAFKLKSALDALAESNMHIIKTGRTHLQDATPLTLGQEISAWAHMLKVDIAANEQAMKPLQAVAIGGTAVGTGLNAPNGFDLQCCEYLSGICGFEVIPSENKFHALSSKGEVANAHGSLKALACDLIKIANDIRLLASGPRAGIGEINIPENEPGSSIMPGKVNPTQSEAMIMACMQVIANDTSIAHGASFGNYQLNVCMPLIANSFLQSARLLKDAISSMLENCVAGITPNLGTIEKNLENSLMSVAALNPYIGYENAAKIAKHAHQNSLSLREAVSELGMMTEEDFEKAMDYKKMVFGEKDK
ncbi:MAG: class II fumarate hydratase [Eubacteriaceae bacterium]|nr:class II fumarate hydratase [Eubacteriaceae bacterium]